MHTKHTNIHTTISQWAPLLFRQHEVAYLHPGRVTFQTSIWQMFSYLFVLLNILSHRRRLSLLSRIVMWQDCNLYDTSTDVSFNLASCFKDTWLCWSLNHSDSLFHYKINTKDPEMSCRCFGLSSVFPLLCCLSTVFHTLIHLLLLSSNLESWLVHKSLN